MRTRLSVLVFGLVAALLAGCGGGGSSPAPAPTPAFGNRPAAVGDRFGYTGSMTETFVRPPLGAGDVTPAPNPTNSATIVTAVTQTVSVTEPATFNGVANPFDFHTAETDTVSGGLKTSTIATDDYYEYLASGAGTQIYFLGSASATSDDVSYSTTIGSGNGLVDVLPETTGAITPANTAAETTSETDADGATLTRTTAAAGTYTESGSNADGTTTSAALAADGSGSYTFPLLAPVDSTYTVSAPAPNPSGGPKQISIVLTVPAILVQATPAANATPVAIPEPPVDVWYPQPLVISKQSLTDDGTTAIPAGCDVASSLKRSARAIVDATTTIDPVFGESDVNTTTSYTEDNVGVACVTLSDVVTQYYDLSGQTQTQIIAFASTPYQVTTTTETLGLTSATVLAKDAREKTLSVTRDATAIGMRASLAHFRAVLEKHRLIRRARFVHALAARSPLSGGIR